MPIGIVTVMEAGERLRNGGPTSYRTFLDWQQQNQVLDDLSAFAPEYVNLTGGGEPERLGGIRISPRTRSPSWARARLPAAIFLPGNSCRMANGPSC